MYLMNYSYYNFISVLKINDCELSKALYHLYLDCLREKFGTKN